MCTVQGGDIVWMAGGVMTRNAAFSMEAAVLALAAYLHARNSSNTHTLGGGLDSI